MPRTKRPRRQLGADIDTLTDAERGALADFEALGAEDAHRLEVMAAEVRSMTARLNLGTSPCLSCGREHYDEQADFQRHQILDAAASRLEKVAGALRADLPRG